MKKLLMLVCLLSSLQNLMATNGALQFDGVDDLVTLPATLWHNNFSGGTAITVEFWYRTTEITNTYVMDSVYRVQAGANYFVAGYYGGGTPCHLMSIDSIPAGNKATIENQAWHHLAMTWSKGGLFTSYLDGTQVVQNAAVNVDLPTMNVVNCLGAYRAPDGGSTSEHLTGILDEVRIWNVVRTAAEIRSNMNVELVGNETGLIAYYNMNGGSGTTLSDNATSGSYSGTLVNGVHWTTDAPGVTPTRVVLCDLFLQIQNGSPTVCWQTASEEQTVGFNLYRWTDGTWKKVNETLVQAQGKDGMGSSYTVVDVAANAEATFRYKLVEIESDGNLQEYGPYDRAANNPRLQWMTFTPEGVEVRWLGREGATYEVQKCVDMKSGFQTIAMISSPHPDPLVYRDAESIYPTFYRIREK